MSSTAVAVLKLETGRKLEITHPIRGLPLPWRDPSTVSRTDLANYIGTLERLCEGNPGSPDVQTCLGIAYAMNCDAYKSMDALEAAVAADPLHFFAQLKLSELYFRLRALPKAEAETLRAVNLAGNSWELSLAKKQLQEIRRLTREGTQKPEWNKPLTIPVLTLIAMFAVCSVLMMVAK